MHCKKDTSPQAFQLGCFLEAILPLFSYLPVFTARLPRYLTNEELTV